jgi:hypothetical protein
MTTPYLQAPSDNIYSIPYTIRLRLGRNLNPVLELETRLSYTRVANGKKPLPAMKIE